MSLRLLLADESSSIKKAFELALQDYGVQIQTVHQGVDVKEIAERFQPDICFMDIMLPKLNGYDACAAVKADSSLASPPVVLMWSGFMELDSDKFSKSGAEDSIEKPFETQTLRSIVKKLVPSLQDNQISDHLIFDDEIKTVAQASQDTPNLPPDLPPLDSSSFSMGDDEATDPGLNESPALSLAVEDLAEPDGTGLPSLENDNEDPFAGIATDSSDLDDVDSSFLDNRTVQTDSDSSAPEGLEDVDAFSLTSLNEELNNALPMETLSNPNSQGPEGLDLPPIPDPTTEPKVKHAPSQSMMPPTTEVETTTGSDADQLVNTDNTKLPPQLSKEELKRLILAQSKDIIESVVWDVVPELAKEMIQKEINRLTGEAQIESDLR